MFTVGRAAQLAKQKPCRLAQEGVSCNSILKYKTDIKHVSLSNENKI